jgi:hypothetical protein
MAQYVGECLLTLQERNPHLFIMCFATKDGWLQWTSNTTPCFIIRLGVWFLGPRGRMLLIVNGYIKLKERLIAQLIDIKLG